MLVETGSYMGYHPIGPVQFQKSRLVSFNFDTKKKEEEFVILTNQHMPCVNMAKNTLDNGENYSMLLKQIFNYL